MANAPIIVAYDASPNADDAVALAAALAERTDAPLALAHVYRAPHPDSRTSPAGLRGREEFMRSTAEGVLERGSTQVKQARHLVIGSTTTARGVSTLAEQEGAAVVVWGSAQDTPPGQVRPGSAARRLLQGGPCAQAFAPAGGRESATALDDDTLLVVGSRSDAEAGRVAVNATIDQAIRTARGPVVVLAGGRELDLAGIGVADAGVAAVA
jgi:nucleotide-binding universal stress UspA family protein